MQVVIVWSFLLKLFQLSCLGENRSELHVKSVDKIRLQLLFRILQLHTPLDDLILDFGGALAKPMFVNSKVNNNQQFREQPQRNY